MSKDTKSKRVEDLLCTLHYLNSGEAGRFTIFSKPMCIDEDERKLRDVLIAEGFITETPQRSLALTSNGVDEAVAIMKSRSTEEQLQEPYPTSRIDVINEQDYWVRRQQEGAPGSIHWEQVGGRITHLRYLDQRFAEMERAEVLKHEQQPTKRTAASNEELLSADEAIRLLRVQLGDHVESLRFHDANVEAWERVTQKIVDRAFGEQSRNAKHFAVTASYARQSDDEKQAWHMQHISEKKTLLHAFIKELEISPLFALI